MYGNVRVCVLCACACVWVWVYVCCRGVSVLLCCHAGQNIDPMSIKVSFNITGPAYSPFEIARIALSMLRMVLPPHCPLNAVALQHCPLNAVALPLQCVRSCMHPRPAQDLFLSLITHTHMYPYGLHISTVQHDGLYCLMSP